MILWTYRVAVLALAPALSYQLFSHANAALLAGLAAALALVGAECLFGGRKTQCGPGPKLLDASALIDGRVLDVCEAHFISGDLLVPQFVVKSLHALSSSQDQLLRARGRRGLDVLARLQELKTVRAAVLERDVPELKETTAKIARLARELGGQCVTTDFDMHKAAVLEGVVPLNINDLSTALKPVVLPGESMGLFVMKDGKEKEQGVGYLDDGTMVVVEDGRRWVGKRVEATVNSILQTSSGKMIFAKAHPEARQQQEH